MIFFLKMDLKMMKNKKEEEEKQIPCLD